MLPLGAAKKLPHTWRWEPRCEPLLLRSALRLPLLLLLIECASLPMGTGANVTDLVETGLRGGLGSGDCPRGECVLSTVFSGAAGAATAASLRPAESGCTERRRCRRTWMSCASDIQADFSALCSRHALLELWVAVTIGLAFADEDRSSRGCP